MTFPYPGRVPHTAVERLVGNFEGLRQAVADALASVDRNDPGAARWQRAAELLWQEDAVLQKEAEHFRLGERNNLLQHALELRLLARRMDGYPLSFAGDERGKAIAQHRQLLVLTAWQITAAASGSEAAGL